MKDIVAKLEAATEGSRELDEAICREMEGLQDTDRWKAIYDHDYGFCLYDEADCEYIEIRSFTRSIDAALTLYPTKPERVPSDPRLACIDALKAQGVQK